MSSTEIFDVIMSHQSLWPLFLTIVPSIELNIRLDLSDHRSLNIDEKVILEGQVRYIPTLVGLVPLGHGRMGKGINTTSLIFKQEQHIQFDGTQSRIEEGGWVYYGKAEVEASVISTPKQQPRSEGEATTRQNRYSKGNLQGRITRIRRVILKFFFRIQGVHI